jgi:hypothetical protein
MRDWVLNSKNKSVCSYLHMINALKIRIWIIKRIKKNMNHLPGWSMNIYNP